MTKLTKRKSFMLEMAMQRKCKECGKNRVFLEISDYSWNPSDKDFSVPMASAWYVCSDCSFHNLLGMVTRVDFIQDEEPMQLKTMKDWIIKSRDGIDKRFSNSIHIARMKDSEVKYLGHKRRMEGAHLRNTLHNNDGRGRR